jgi:hypothetical protein
MKSLMKKKGVAILLMSSIAFFIAILIFANVSVNKMPGPKSEYIGEIQLEIFEQYGLGENFLFYLEMAAEKTAKSIKITPDMTKEDYIKEFKSIFAKHLDNFENIVIDFTHINLTIDDYEIKIQGSKLFVNSKVNLRVLNERTPWYIKSQMEYKIDPSFVVKIEDLKKLKDSVFKPIPPPKETKTSSTVPLR